MTLECALSASKMVKYVAAGAISASVMYATTMFKMLSNDDGLLVLNFQLGE